MQSECTECGNKRSSFVKEQKAKSLLSILGIKTPLSKKNSIKNVYKMNEIVNKFLLINLCQICT